MEQQLNIIEPVAFLPELAKPRTPEEILKLPVKNVPNARRGTKLNFGLMSARKIVENIEQREVDHKEAENAKEIAAVRKAEEQKSIADAEAELRQERADLKAKSDAIKAIKAEAAAKRKAEKNLSQREPLKKKAKKLPAEVSYQNGKDLTIDEEDTSMSIIHSVSNLHDNEQIIDETEELVIDDSSEKMHEKTSMSLRIPRKIKVEQLQLKGGKKKGRLLAGTSNDENDLNRSN